jgi:hypothetical protein
MTFLGINPITAAFLFAAAAGVFIILHFLRNRYRVQTVAGIMLWREVIGKPSRRMLFGRLSALLSLLMMLLCAAALLAALSEPVTPGPKPERTVIIYDAEGADAASAFAENLNPAVFAVIAAGKTPRTVKNFNERFIPAARPPEEHSELSEAIRLAEILLDGEPNGQIAVFSRSRPVFDARGMTYHGPELAQEMPDKATSIRKIRLKGNAPEALKLLIANISALEPVDSGDADIVLDEYPDFTAAQWTDPEVVTPYLRSLLVDGPPENLPIVRQATLTELPAPAAAKTGMDWFNLLIAAALLFLLIDFVLYFKQRIP